MKSFLSGQLLGFCLITCGLFIGSSKEEVQEVCLREKFNVTCPPHHVINVKVAKFGRLKTGRCITKTLILGCYEVVTDDLGGLCSGRQSCSVDVLSAFARLTPCTEMESYLEVEYNCMAVTEVTPNQCRAFGHGLPSHPLSQPRGIISSYFIKQVMGLQMKPTLGIPDLSRGGKPEDRGCVIELLTNPGMRWNISLVNFLAPAFPMPLTNRNLFSSEPGSLMVDRDSKAQRIRGMSHTGDNLCRKLFVIREFPDTSGKEDRSSYEKASKIVGRPKADNLVTSCDSWVRERVVYVSDCHRLTIEFIFPDLHYQKSSSSSSSSSSGISSTENQQATAYLLKYQAFGCSDPEVVNGSFQRIGHTEATVSCPLDREVHRLTCVGDQHWEPTGRIVCSGVGDHSTWRFSPDLSTFHGVAFILILGVSLGVVVGCSLLAVTVCFYKKRTTCHQHSMPTTTTTSGHTTYTPFFYQQQQQQQQQQQECDKMRTYDQQRQLLQPQYRDNFQVDFKSPKNARRMPTNVQTPLLGQTLSQKLINNNTINTTAASSHPTLLLHQSLATTNPAPTMATSTMDITPLLISDSMPPGECFHHHHHHHHHLQGSQVPMSGAQQVRMVYPGVQFDPDIYGDESLERALSNYPVPGVAGSKPPLGIESSQLPALMGNGEKLQRKMLDSFPSQNDHIYEIAG